MTTIELPVPDEPLEIKGMTPIQLELAKHILVEAGLPIYNYKQYKKEINKKSGDKEEFVLYYDEHKYSTGPYYEIYLNTIHPVRGYKQYYSMNWHEMMSGNRYCHEFMRTRLLELVKKYM